MTGFGATPDEWSHFDLILGLTADLLPVVSDPSARISENSSIKQLGKLPSLYNHNRKVIGFTGWTEHQSTPYEIDIWQKEPDYGICLIGRVIKFLDIDIEDRNVSAKIAFFIAERLGVLPMRTRANSGKLLLALTLPGEYPKRTLKTKHGLVEFLGHKQQAVVAGTHTSGTRYEWLPSLPDHIPEIDPGKFEKCWLGLSAIYGIEDPSESSNRKPFQPTNFLPDPLADFLTSNWKNYGTGKEGEIRILCPFKAEHTIDNGPSETVYFRAGTRDYNNGHFSCMHAHCENRTDYDFQIATGYLASDFEEVKEPEAQRNRFEPIRADIFTERPPVEWIIKGILPRGKLGMTYGGSGDGKTFAVLDMVLSICLGIPWNSHKVKRGHCLYICAEGAGGFTTRLKAYAEKNGVPLKDIGDYLTIIPETPNFRLSNDVKSIAGHLTNRPYKTDFIVVDTLAQVTTGADENSAKDMSIAIHNAELLHDLTGSTVHLIHHAGKDEARGARGWSGMKGPLDVQFSVLREGDNRHFRIVKLKDGQDGFGYDFQLRKIVVGKDMDADDIESCYVEYTGKTPVRLKLQPRGKKQALILDTFEELGGGRIANETLIHACMAKMPRLDTNKRDRRRDMIVQALEGIIEDALLQTENGCIFESEL